MNRLNKTKNTIQGTFWGILNKLTAILCPFVIRTIIIRLLGAEYAGLSSLYTSILHVLSLAELGIGSAMVYQMYEPVARDDKAALSALLAYYRRAYAIISLVILGIGLAICPFVRFLIKGTIPQDINIYILFLIYLLNTVASYSCLAYRGAILSAYQREADKSMLQLISHLVMYVCQVLALLTLKNYYVYIAFLPISTVLFNVLKYCYVKKHYPDILCGGEITGEQKASIKQNISALFMHKVGGAVVNTIDNIVISVFMGLVILANYGNYYFILSAVTSIVTIVFTSLTAGIGNSIITSDASTVKKHFYSILYLNGFIVMVCTVCFFNMYQDFITQWVGAACLFGFDTMVLMCVYFFVHTIRRTIIMYRDAAGMWVDNRWQPIVSAIVNLTLNIVLIHLIGINGIVISTIISMVLVDIPWETKALINRLFRESVVRYCLVVLYFALITVAGCLITWLLLRRIPAESLLVRLALECGASVLIGAGVFLGLTVFMPEQKWMISRLKGAIVHKQS